MTKQRFASSRSAERIPTKRLGTTRRPVSNGAVTAAAFDAKFDAGEDMTAHLDLESTRQPGREVQRVNVDFPRDLLQAIDAAADRIGVTRQAFIKMRLADSLERAK
jgi:hypothetical protein